MVCSDVFVEQLESHTAAEQVEVLAEVAFVGPIELLCIGPKSANEVYDSALGLVEPAR